LKAKICSLLRLQFVGETDELFFALSSGDRTKLLSEISSQELRLTDPIGYEKYSMGLLFEFLVE
jgi:hypothetical protein